MVWIWVLGRHGTSSPAEDCCIDLPHTHQGQRLPEACMTSPYVITRVPGSTWLIRPLRGRAVSMARFGRRGGYGLYLVLHAWHQRNKHIDLALPHTHHASARQHLADQVPQGPGGVDGQVHLRLPAHGTRGHGGFRLCRGYQPLAHGRFADVGRLPAVPASCLLLTSSSRAWAGRPAMLGWQTEHA